MFPFLLLLHIKRTKLCKWRLPHTNFLLWCEYEWTGVNRDAWDYVPARSVQHNGCWAGFQSIGGTQSSACWGYNGLIKAPCFTGEKTLLHSINQYHLLRSRKVSPFSHPARRLRLEGIVDDGDLWPALDMLMQQRNVETNERGWREVEHLCEVSALSSENVLGCDVSMFPVGHAACGLMVIHVAHCAAFLWPLWVMRLRSDFPARECELCFMWTTDSAPRKILLRGTAEPDGPSQPFVCSVTEEVNGFNMRYCGERSGS